MKGLLMYDDKSYKFLSYPPTFVLDITTLPTSPAPLPLYPQLSYFQFNPSGFQVSVVAS